LLTIPLMRRLPHKVDERDSTDERIETSATSLAAALQGSSRPPTDQPAVAP
jgi:hypothetical protein